MRVSQADFLSWREHPVTQWVLSALEAKADEQKASWDAAAWLGGEADSGLLIELRTRADAYRAIGEVDYPTLCATVGQEPFDE